MGVTHVVIFCSSMKKSLKLRNYLRRYRKCSGLSQVDLAFLFGCRDGSKVSRYEHFSRQPSLRTALTYEAIFGVAARELFAGLYENVRHRSAVRAGALIQRLNCSKPDRGLTRRISVLRGIAGAEHA